MAAFPTLSTGTTAFYPVTEAIRFKTGIVRHLDFSEQRYREQAKLQSFVVEWRNLSRADKNSIVSFFDTNKGPFDSTWEFPIGGDTWDFCAFEEDSLSVREERPNRFIVRLAFHQVRKN